MLYKWRLSDKGNRREAEWLPIETIDDSRGEKINRTTAEGVVFITHPPDLRTEPSVEPFHDEKESKPADFTQRLLKNFKLDAEAEAEWRALLKIHEFGRTVIA